MVEVDTFIAPDPGQKLYASGRSGRDVAGFGSGRPEFQKLYVTKL